MFFSKHFPSSAFLSILPLIGHNLSECNKGIDFCGGDKEWEKYFNDLLQKNDIESLNAISSAINRLSSNSDAISENLYKLSSVMEFAGVMFDDNMLAEIYILLPFAAIFVLSERVMTS